MERLIRNKIKISIIYPVRIQESDSAWVLMENVRVQPLGRCVNFYPNLVAERIVMETFGVEEFKELLLVSGPQCVSIFLPTHRKGPEIQQDPIRLKNLVREAERQLVEAGVKSAQIEELLSPAKALAEDIHFWRYQSEGLCLFLGAGVFKSFRLPAAFSEVVVVNDRLHLKPLSEFLSTDDRFFLLSLSHNCTTLFSGSRYGLIERKVDGLPKSLSDVVAEKEKDQTVQARSASGSGQGSSMFHGHFETDRDKDELLRYFREIDKALAPTLKEGTAPLLLSGVEYLLSLYRSINSYRFILTASLVGNYDRENSDTLFDKAWPLIQPVFSARRESALAEYQRLCGTGKTSSGLGEVLLASHGGRVHSLLVSKGTNAWGRYNAEKNEVRLDENNSAENEDLLDLCAKKTFSNGGTVYLVSESEMPEHATVAAVLRY